MEEEYQLPKELADRIWARDYLDELSKMGWSRLFYALLESQESDDYDGGFTSRKMYEAEIAVGYFRYRLRKLLIENHKLIRKEDHMEGLTVGRIVHYVAYGTPKGEYPQGAHRAAIVTEVLNEAIGEVSLCVLNPTGIFFKERIFYSKDTTAPGTWHWTERD